MEFNEVQWSRLHSRINMEYYLSVLIKAFIIRSPRLEIWKSINQLSVFSPRDPCKHSETLKISSIFTANPAKRAKHLTNQPLFELMESFGIDEIANQLLWTAKRC